MLGSLKIPVALLVYMNKCSIKLLKCLWTGEVFRVPRGLFGYDDYLYYKSETSKATLGVKYA